MTIFDEDLQWIDEFFKEIRGQSDRAAAVIGASVLDELLRAVLIDFFIGDKKRVGELLENNGPLGTLSSRIDVSFCLGLVSKQEQEDLHIIRKIRNDFAHKLSKTSFNESPIRERCLSLKLYKRVFKEKASPRIAFEKAVTYLVLTLILRSLEAHNQHRSIPDEIPPIRDFTAAFLEYSQDKAKDDKIPPLEEILRSLGE